MKMEMKMDMKKLGAFALALALAAGAARAAEIAAGATCAEIQAAIDAASAAGGGRVSLAPGKYVVAQLKLKDGVELHLAKDAVLEASTNRFDYCADEKTYGRLAVVCAYGAKGIALTGEGRMEGRGDEVGLLEEGPNRWRMIHFIECEDVRVEGVEIYRSNYWTFYLERCRGVTVRKVKIDSPCNYNNDGIDIEAKDCLIEDCDIDTDDDAICFKSDDPAFVTERCEVRNCRISSHCNFIKFGTASHGVFRDISIHDCKISARSKGVRDWADWHEGVSGREWGISAVALEVVDGGGMERVTVRDIDVENGVIIPIFIRLGARRFHREMREPYLRDVTVENLRYAPGAYSSQPVFVSGVPGLRVRNVTIRNVNFAMLARGTPADAKRQVGEFEKSYPEIHNFARIFPCTCVFVRHADGVRFENVTAHLVKLAAAAATVDAALVAAEDPRPPVVQYDATGVVFENCSFPPAAAEK